MKSLIAIAITVLTISSVYAQVKCAPDGRGGMCCWDIQSQGPFRPIGC